ncbi:TetR/AcrR family transcriptional regulator [Agromyces sp. MMS24-K17]|uniref:TetR/AcrR family transcriptional regulator n=1 Tax=Agromyces sp. MMS24-K17 TaxID=3372850 RepID=UPI003754A1FE
MQPVTDAERRAPRRDAAENRESLLTAAAACLAESPDASLLTIAEAAGLTRRAVYGHFANRDELVLALISRGAERLNAVVVDPHLPASADDGDAPAAIARLAGRLWHAVEHVRVLAAMAVQAPYIDQVALALAPVRAALLDLVERGAAAGTVRGDIPPALLARLIERAAIAVLLEAAAERVAAGDGRRLAMLAVLSTAGLDWRAAGAVADAQPAAEPEAQHEPEAA